MAPVKAFRSLALGYALVSLLVAPSWLAADEQVPPVPETAVEQATAPATEPAPAAPKPAPHAGQPAPEPAGVVEEPPEAVADEEPAGAEKRKRRERKDEPVAKAAADGSVTITDFKFTPETITVNEGDTVTWTNEGPTPHTATAEDGSFDTGNLDTGESGSATFTQAGTIAYICTPHPAMTGKVVVKGTSAGSDGAADDTDDDAAAGGDDARSADDGDGLPATGTETLLIALLGLATLGAGLLLRRRASD